MVAGPSVTEPLHPPTSGADTTTGPLSTSNIDVEVEEEDEEGWRGCGGWGASGSDGSLVGGGVTMEDDELDVGAPPASDVRPPPTSVCVDDMLVDDC